jgi:molybdopterin synthase catalytic subunit
MSDSQSRYSIVERLTQRKLDIMTAKAELKDKLKQKEQTIEELKHEIIIWKEDVEEDMKRQKRNLERDIEKAQQDY